MAAAVGIQLDPLPLSEQFYLQGLEPGWEDVGRRWIRLASEYPETIDRVDFYRNGALYDSAYDESFSLHFRSNWMQGPVRVQPDDKEWKAVIHLSDGQIIEKTARL
ncbi:MAG: hypothetical protein O3A46_14800 [Candidatus Poribacteria bacterium]|nr:hypothetical protein [Candidatus Poribacteria bacterium]